MDKDSVSLYGYPVKEKSDKVIPLYQRKSEKLTRIDFNNKVVSECVFKTNIKNEYIDNIHFLNNGEYIVEYGRNNSEDIREENARFVHYSKDFKELRELALTGYSIREIIETEDERIFCCWNAVTYDDRGSAEDRECVYTAFDMDWNLLWQKGVKEEISY